MAQVSDLSSHFPYDRILAVAGVSVKGSVPDITACPICRKPSLTAYSDPLTTQSVWLRCGSCRFSGDTIEMFQRISRTPDLRAAIHEARMSGLCNADVTQLTPLDIEKYVNFLPAFRAKVSDIWEKLAGGTVTSPSPELIHQAQRRGLWHGWMRSPHPQMTRFLGGGERREINGMFEALLDKSVLPRKGFGVFLSTPYQDVPGRICGFNFMGLREDLMVPITPLDVDVPEGGLAMLDALDGLEKTVFAVPRLDLALHCHRLNFINREAPLKLVAYTDTTRTAWNAVNAERLIFWSDETDWRVFRQAKKFKNAWLSDRPRLEEAKNDITVLMAERSPDVLLRIIESAALPWPVFLARWFMDRKRNPLEIQATLVSGEFTPEEIETIVAASPERDRGELHRLLTEFSRKETPRIMLGGRSIIAKADGWYMEGGKGSRGDSLITDAKVVLAYETTDMQTREVGWGGEIQYEGHKIPFSDESPDLIDKDPVKWLQNKIAEAGLGHPRFDKTWAKQFKLMVQNFNMGRRKMNTTLRLGLTTSNIILFPAFIIENGEIKPGIINRKNMPVNRVKKPELRRIAKAEPVTAARAAWFAAAAAYVARITRKLTCPVYIVDCSSARTGASSFMEMADFLQESSEDGSTADKQRLTGLDAKYNYPIHLRASSRALSRLPYDSCARCFISTDRMTAFSLCTLNAGIILRDAPLEEGEVLPPFDDVLWYLASLQPQGFVLDSGSHPVVSALRGFCQFLPGYLHYFDDAHAALALNHIRVLPRRGDGLLELLVLLCTSGKLKQEQGNLGPFVSGESVLSPKAKCAWLDVEHGCVYFPHKAVLKACNDAGLPYPDVYTANRDLTDRKMALPCPSLDGTLLASGFWDERIRSHRADG